MDRRITGLLAASACAGVLFGTLASAGLASHDPVVAGCGLGNEIAGSYQLAQARHIWQFLPAMGRAPELEQDTSPASFVVYSGNVETLVSGRAGTQREQLHNAVCVLQSNGERIVYVNISRSGFRRP